MWLQIIHTFFLILLILCPSDIDENIRSTTSENFNDTYPSYRWPERELPLNIYAPLKYKIQLQDFYEKGCEQWNRAAGRLLVRCLWKEYDPQLKKELDPEKTNGMIYFARRITRSNEDTDSILAITTSSRLGGKILTATIIFNQSFSFYYRGHDKDSILPHQFDFLAVFTHELGHFLGLPHSNRITSIMYDRVRNGLLINRLSLEDKKKIRHLYRKKRTSQSSS